MDYARVVLILRAAGCVFAEDEARLLVDSARDPADLERMLSRRVSGVPLEHILGWAEFAGHRILVDEGVFVPRRRTEFLASRAVALAAGHEHPVVLDLCCGSGAIAATVLAALPGAQITAADIDPRAVATARRNLPPPSTVVEGDLFEPLPDSLQGRIDMLVCNTPYVPTDAVGTMPPEARLFEAAVALDGGDDGLDVQRRVAARAHDWLAPGGHVLVEVSESQAPLSAELFERGGLEARVDYSEDYDTTIVIATRRP